MVLHRKGCEQQRSLFPNRQTLACLSIIQTDEESVLSSRKTGQWHVSLIDDNLTSTPATCGIVVVTWRKITLGDALTARVIDVNEERIVVM